MTLKKVPLFVNFNKINEEFAPNIQNDEYKEERDEQKTQENTDEKKELSKDDEIELITLIKDKDQSISDAEIHTFSEEKGYNNHEVEAFIYKLLAKFLNVAPIEDKNDSETDVQSQSETNKEEETENKAQISQEQK